MTTKKFKVLFFLFGLGFSTSLFAQDDLLSGMEDKNTKQYISNAFKSSRVINGHSMEFIGKGVLDTRILQIGRAHV